MLNSYYSIPRCRPDSAKKIRMNRCDAVTPRTHPLLRPVTSHVHYKALLVGRTVLKGVLAFALSFVKDRGLVGHIL